MYAYIRIGWILKSKKKKIDSIKKTRLPFWLKNLNIYIIYDSTVPVTLFFLKIKDRRGFTYDGIGITQEYTCTIRYDWYTIENDKQFSGQTYKHV